MSSDDAAHPQSKAFLSNDHNYSGNRLDESCCGFNRSGTTTVNTVANLQIKMGGRVGGWGRQAQTFSNSLLFRMNASNKPFPVQEPRTKMCYCVVETAEMKLQTKQATAPTKEWTERWNNPEMKGGIMEGKKKTA